MRALNVKTTYLLLQLINGALWMMSFLFVSDRLEIFDDKSVTKFLILAPIVVAGPWAYSANRWFYEMLKEHPTKPPQL